ncbi:hypothetical protein [Algibacter sp. 2305UL17-15]|uniref:hypothetical protein n=1 Tax=Algibacter sp. 2305UL17-15 TaxID=3231268 RepID=UPI003459016D
MKYNLFLPLLLLISTHLSFSQSKSQVETYYNLFDAFIPYENRDIFNGSEYIDEYPELVTKAKTNNKFYGSYNFVKGYINYDGQPYFNLEMKYDLLRDLVVLEFVNKKVNYLSLNSTLVNEFEILGAKFVRLENNSVLNSNYRNGFFKEAFNGKAFSFYVKYRKDKRQDLSEKKERYVFNEHQFYFVQHDKKFYRITSKKDILKAFPSYQKEIRLFYRKNPVLRRTSKAQFFTNLFMYLDGINLEKAKN